LRRATVTAALGMLAAAGCSSSGGGGTSSGGSSGGGLGAAQACSDYATAECNVRNGCTNGFAITIDFGDVSTCQSRLEASCANALAAPGTGSTPAHVEGCAQALGGQSCFDYFTNATPAACATPAGTLAAGAGCAFSAQCQSAFCAIESSEVCGTCQAAPQAGSACGGGVGCGDGLICFSDSESCGVGVEDGGACSDHDACGAGESCVGLVDGGHGTCVPRGGVSAPCDPKEGTEPSCFGAGGIACVRGVRDAGTCLPISVETSGATCGTVAGQADAVCGTGGLCVKSSPDGGTGACQGYVSDGQSCDSVLGPPCVTPAKCVPATDGGTAGTCTLPNGSLCH